MIITLEKLVTCNGAGAGIAIRLCAAPLTEVLLEPMLVTVLMVFVLFVRTNQNLSTRSPYWYKDSALKYFCGSMARLRNKIDNNYHTKHDLETFFR
jgi:hypothetical protein